MPNDELSDVAVEILLSLAKGPQHGYAIKLDVEQRAAADYVLGSGSLYQALRRLERRGYLAADTSAAPSADARRGKTYRIEPEGRAALEAELARMRRVLEVAAGQVVADPGSSR
jgi:DNA-binding PadR family transcriptional regulator